MLNSPTSFALDEQPADDAFSDDAFSLLSVYPSITIGQTTISYFNYPNENKRFSFLSTARQYLSFSYSGPTCGYAIYDADSVTWSDRLCDVANFSSSPDLYYFDCNREYVVELSLSNGIGYGGFGFTPSVVTTSLPEFENYVLHVNTGLMTFLGFRYSAEYYDTNTVTYSRIECGNASSVPSSYTPTDASGYFYNTIQSGSESRRKVSDLSSAEYGAVTYVNSVVPFYLGW